MNLKQVLATVGISALTTLGVVWGYNSYLKNSMMYAGQSANTLPSNYRLTGNGNTPPPGVAIDFTQPSMIALPAVVHIKTSRKNAVFKEFKINS